MMKNKLMRVLSTLGCVLGWLACGGNETPKPEMAAPLKTAPTENAPASAAPAAPAAQEPAPTLALKIVATQAGVGLRVINAGSRSVSLAADVALLDSLDSKAATIDATALKLMLTCQSSGCVSLAPGAEIDAPSWLERVAGERCGALIAPKANGTYRLRVRSCSGAHERDVDFVWPSE